MFHSARLKLTFWYVLIASIITLLFSLLSYNSLRGELDRSLQRQRYIIEQQYPRNNMPPSIIFHRVDPDLAEEMRERLLLRIVYIDAVVILVAALGGYVLAGRTLKPIQKMVDEQNRFITDASHELRTPLTALRTELETSLLEKEISSKEAKALMKSNLEEVIHLQKLSDYLLSLTKYPFASKKKSFEKVVLRTMLEQSIKRVASLANKKSIMINNTITKGSIVGDQQSLTELFVLLLDNAIKYSPVKSTVTLSAKGKDHFIEITVSDTGIGIAEKDIPYIFDRFFRSDRSRTKSSVNGYGLGLSIAREIVEYHKGTISVKSKIKEGTTFTITLPKA